MTEKALISLDELVARVQKHETIDSIIRSVLPGGHREAFKRCALVRSFDEQMFSSVLAVGIQDPPAFQDLVASDDVQALPRSSGRYRLHGAARSRWFEVWWDDAGAGVGASDIPAKLRETADRLVKFYRDTESPVDELASLVCVDQQRARELFVRLFDEADGRFNLAACRDALDAVGEGERGRTRLLGPSLKDEVDARALYLRVRALWADDWHRTARFLQPAGLREPFVRLLEGRPSRFLELYARGGMGKTMRLRWLIARWLVPQRTPVTRIDFDLVDPLNATGDPWLVLVELARQLTDQLPRGPFTELTTDYGRFLPLLYRSMEGSEAAATAIDIGSIRQRAAADVPVRLTAGINESTDVPVVMIFDTMEEVLLRSSANLKPLEETLHRIQAECPSVRLVFSGRYRIRGKARRFADAFPGLVTVHVAPFTDDEARRYLQEHREIRDHELVEAAVQKAGRLPFKLALFADLLQERPDIMVEDIRAYHDPDLLYLIERVVERLPGFGVRWLLRYGAIPRVLTRRFVKEFLAPYLVRGMSGDPKFDEPRLDGLPPSRTGTQRLPFSTDVPDDPSERDPDALWRRLRAYVASASWVTAERTDVVRFHTDVVNPMRRILRQQPAFGTLNADAIGYFSSLAEQEQGLWGVWIREAVHHAFQLRGNAATSYWAEMVGRAAAIGRHDWQRMLAREVLDRETLGPGGERIAPEDGSELLALETVALANFELAAANADEAQALGVGAPHGLWSEARSHFDLAVSLDGGRGTLPPERVALVGSALLRRDADLDPKDRPAKLAQAVTMLEGATGRARDPLDRLRLEAVLAEVLAEQGELQPAGDMAERVASSGLAMLEGGVAGQVAATRLAGSMWRVARQLIQADRLDRAERLLGRSAGLAERSGPDAVAEAARLGAEVALRSGLPARAEAGLDQEATPQDEPRLWARQELVRARARVASHRPADAIPILRQLLDAVPAPLAESGPEEAFGLEAELREVLGEALGAVADLRRASEELDAAVGLWIEAGARDRAAAVACRHAALQLHAAGNLNQAASQLDSADSLRPEPGSDSWASARLLRTELLARRGELRRSLELLRRTRDQLESSGSPPGRLTSVALTGLACDPDGAPGWVELLADQLGRIRPREARLAQLAGLVRVAGLAGRVPRKPLNRLRELVSLPRGADGWSFALQDRDRLVLALLAVDFERVVGRAGQAAERLTGLLRELDESFDPFAMLRALQAADRLGDSSLALLDGGRQAALRAALAQFPTMAGVLFVLQCRWRLRVDDPSSAKELVEQADAWLARGAEPATIWAAEASELRAEIEKRLGDQQAAAEAAALADRLRRQLGQRAAPRSAPTGEGAPRVSVALRLGPDRTIEVEGTVSGRQEREVRRVRTEDPLVGELLGGDPPPPPEDVPMGLALSVSRDWWQFGLDLGAMAFDPGWLQEGRKVDVALLVAHRRLVSAPWELLRHPDSRLLSLHPLVATLVRESADQAAGYAQARVVQMALRLLLGRELVVDGVLGPESRKAVEDFQRAERLQPTGEVDRPTATAIRLGLTAQASDARPLALVARPSFERQRVRVRGEQAEGSDVARTYLSLGFEVVTLEDPTLLTLREAVGSFAERKAGLAIVHLSAGITVSSGTLSLDFGDEPFLDRPSPKRGGPGQLLSAGTVDRVLRSDRGSPWGPVVVLDVPRPPTLTEAGRMLLLRNLFASDLFQLGGSSAVIATGLADYRSSLAHERLLGALADGACLADAVREVRTLADGDREEFGFPEELAFAATALFTQVPWMGVGGLQ